MGHGNLVAARRLRWSLVWQWLLCVALVLGFAMWAYKSQVLQRMDLAIYDNVLRLNTRPAPADIVIVAVDEASLDTLGGWPWSREIHAQLLDRLADARPRAVALDVLFSEPSGPADAALALSLQRLRAQSAVFLPVTVLMPLVPGRTPQPLRPLLSLEQAATALGHVHVELDADGVVRSLFLREGTTEQMWPSLSWRLLAGRNMGSPVLPDIPWAGFEMAQDGTGWQREMRVLLPFSGPAGHYRTVPYASVLRGEVPAEFLRDKIVLVGLTATGMGDQYPTPFSGAQGLMPGVEINAVAVDGLLGGRMLLPLSSWLQYSLTAAAVLAWMLLLWRTSPRAGLFILLAVLAAGVATSVLLQTVFHLWWPPSVLLVSVLLGYLLWNWMRLAVLLADLRQRAVMLGIGGDLVRNPANAVQSRDGWQKVLRALDESIEAQQVAHHKVRQTLHSLPEAVLVVDDTGQLQMANVHARELLGAADDLLHTLPVWASLMQVVRADATTAQGVELDLRQGVTVLVRSTATYALAEALVLAPWWIVTLVDISAHKQAQRQRNEALQLLSHDLRAPQSAILALLGDRAGAAPGAELLRQRIQMQVYTTLGLADDFVLQLRAESDVYELHEVDLAGMLHEVVERAWPLAQARRVALALDVQPVLAAHEDEEGYWLRVEPRLLRRAFFNLVDNAIKYSPAGSRTVLGLSWDESVVPRCAVVVVRDQGRGVAESDIPHLFDRYARFDVPAAGTPAAEADADVVQGHGLGLALVKTVVERHSGSITCRSVLGRGTVFTIRLPAPEAVP